jgi:microcompartment protein CcmK/EutM
MCVSTVKNESLHSRKLLIVQDPRRRSERARQNRLVALDAVGAGIGELVFWCRGKEASFPFKRDETPTDCTIVGIIDSDAHVFQENSRNKQKSEGNSRKRAQKTQK